MLDAGKRYAWFTVTVGNHALAFVNNNKYAQGTMFWSTDGAWSQGSNTEDFAFRLNAASFESLRTQVYFNSLTCPLGMTEIQLLYNGWAPPGTSLTWEIKPTGLDDWQFLEPTPDVNDNPLVGQPALCQLRATFIGTTDLMPAIILNSSSRSVASKPRSDKKAVSKVLNLGVTASSFTVTTVVDAFDPAYNTFANRLIVDATTYTPDATTITADYDKSGRYTYRSTFTTPATTSVRYHALADTSNVVVLPFIQNSFIAAL